MNISLSVEIHFHEQEKASIFLESNSTGNNGKFGELSLFTRFAVRMISNLGVCQFSDQLATLLLEAPSKIHELPKEQNSGGLQLISYPGHQGRKNFFAQLSISETEGRFNFQQKGFGWLSTGIGYYGPLAVFGLLRFLSIRNSADSDFLIALGNSAAMVGQSQLSRQIGIGKHDQICTWILASTGSKYLE